MPAHVRPELAALSGPIDTLTPFPENPNNGDVDRIASLLRRHGQYRPVVAWRQLGAPEGRPSPILAGNTTYAAAMSCGMTELARTYVEADTWDEAVAILLADNHSARLAKRDLPAEVDLLLQLDDIADAGYSTRELDELQGQIERDSAEVLGSPPGDPETRAGAGLREALLMLPEADHAELMRLIDVVRETTGPQTQGMVVLLMARVCTAVLDGGAGHPRECPCDWCSIARQAGAR